MPALGPIISVKPRLGVDLLFTLLFESQDNPGLSRSANWREHVWRRFLVFIPAIRLRLQRLVSHLGEYIAYSIVKHIYLLFNKLTTYHSTNDNPKNDLLEFLIVPNSCPGLFPEPWGGNLARSMEFLNGIRVLIRRDQVSLVAQLVKNLPAMQETWVHFLGWEDPLEKG